MSPPLTKEQRIARRNKLEKMKDNDYKIKIEVNHIQNRLKTLDESTKGVYQERELLKKRLNELLGFL